MMCDECKEILQETDRKAEVTLTNKIGRWVPTIMHGKELQCPECKKSVIVVN